MAYGVGVVLCSRRRGKKQECWRACFTFGAMKRRFLDEW